MKVEFIPLGEGQYVKQDTRKRAIVLHHTAGSGSAESVIRWWSSTLSREGTHYIIERNGRVVQCIDEKYWAHHLGTKFKNNVMLNAQSIGIELVNWGWVVDGRSYAGRRVEDVVDIGRNWRGYRTFERYTEKQLDAAMLLVRDIAQRWNIPLQNDYSVEAWFEVNQNAISGASGVWTHASYRSDKTDCSPQPELIARLRALS